MSSLPLSEKEILDKCRKLQTRFSAQERRWQDVRAARKGDLDAVFPDLVSEDWPKPIIANFVDTVARDLAEMVAPLPSFNCSSATMQSDSARRFADRRTKIAQNYVGESQLDVQMQWGADHYFTYGTTVFYIEPCFESRSPRVIVEEPLGGYAEFDRFGRVTSYTKRFYGDSDRLQVEWPEHAKAIAKAAKRSGLGGSDNVELVRYCDGDQVALVLVAQEPLMLVDTVNRLGRCPVVVAFKPWLDPRVARGQFDDVIWVQLARDVLAKLQLEATQKAVQAPLALPQDVQEIALGPDAVIRTATPEKVRRVGMELTPAAFQQSEFLSREMREGTRYPQARTGGMDASIVTGRGVQALMGGFDSQIKAAQAAFKVAFTEVIGLCFRMDETLWPQVTKNIRGQANGTPFELSYKPARDIAGDYSCDVTYGFASGLDPNRAVVMLLQLRAEKAFSRDFFVRQLPLDINVLEEQTKVDVEETREALKQGIFGYVQAIPAMAQAGQDPADAVGKLTAIVKGLQKGKPIEDVVSAAFAPRPVPAPPGAPTQASEEMAPGGAPAGPGGPGGVGGGLTESGLMRGVPSGQAGQAPGGRPDLNVMLAGLTGSGQPQMSAFTMRRRRV